MSLDRLANMLLEAPPGVIQEMTLGDVLARLPVEAKHQVVAILKSGGDERAKVAELTKVLQPHAAALESDPRYLAYLLVTFFPTGAFPAQPDNPNEQSFAEGSSAHLILSALLEDEEKPDDWIGVDLDGTLAKYTEWKGATKIGEPIPAMVKRLRRWVGHGKKVKIFTARADDEKSVNAIKKWLKDNELPSLEITNLKDKFMTELWDDRAVAVVKNTGEVKEAFEPDAHQVAWARMFLSKLNDGAIWGIPDSGQVYKVDHQAKTLTLIRGPVNDPFNYHQNGKAVFAKLGYRVLDGPENPDEMTVVEAIVEQVLDESPQIATLEKHRVDLEPEERTQIMKAKAVWPFGKNGADSPAIHKATVGGKHWYWSNTHRLGQVRSTLRAAISAFHNIVEPSG